MSKLFVGLRACAITGCVALAAGSALAESVPAAGPKAPSATPVAEISSVHQWVVDKMVSWSPPGRTYVRDAKETPEEGRDRYELIADAAVSVAFDPSEPPLFHGKYARSMTLALMMSVTRFESGYRKDVDLGVGPLSKGDGGKSWCMAQIMMGRGDHLGRTRTRLVMSGNGYSFVSDPTFSTGWGGEDLVQDRAKCFRANLRIMRRSFGACRTQPVQERLTAYAAGNCASSDGRSKSRARVSSAQRWLAGSSPRSRTAS